MYRDYSVVEVSKSRTNLSVVRLIDLNRKTMQPLVHVNGVKLFKCICHH
jgi:hypothetical protein